MSLSCNFVILPDSTTHSRNDLSPVFKELESTGKNLRYIRTVNFRFRELELKRTWDFVNLDSSFGGVRLDPSFVERDADSIRVTISKNSDSKVVELRLT